MSQFWKRKRPPTMDDVKKARQRLQAELAFWDATEAYHKANELVLPEESLPGQESLPFDQEKKTA